MLADDDSIEKEQPNNWNKICSGKLEVEDENGVWFFPELTPPVTHKPNITLSGSAENYCNILHNSF